MQHAADISRDQGGRSVGVEHNDQRFRVQDGPDGARVRATSRTVLIIDERGRRRERLTREDRDANTRYAQEMLDNE